MRVNVDKCHLLVISDESCTDKIERFNIKNSTKEKLFGVKFDSNLFLKIMQTLFVKREAKNYRLLQEFHIAWA